MGDITDAIDRLAGGAPAPVVNAGGAAYLNDPKNRAAIMADASQIGAMRPGNGPAPAPARAAPAPAPAAGDGDSITGAIDRMAKSASTPTARAPQATAPKPSVLDLPGAAVEPIATMATGMLGSAIGGVARLGSAVMGSSLEDAKAAGNKVANALTYQPQTDGGKASVAGLSDLASKAKNALMASPVGGAISAVGNAYHDKFVTGATNPLMATVNDMLPTVAANVVAPVAGKVLARGAVAATDNMLASRLRIAGPAPARIEPSMPVDPTPPAPPKPRVKLNVDGTQSPVPAAIPAPAAPATVTGPAPTPAPVVPTLADTTPELQSAVRTMQAKGAPINPAILQRHVEADSLPVPIKLTEGQASLSPAIISDEMNGRGKVQPTVSPDFYNAQGKALGANLDAIRAKVAPDVTDTHPTAHGQALVDAYKTMDAPVRADITAKYQALKDANGGDFPVAGHDIAAAADQGLKADNVTRFLPAEVKGVLDDIRQPGNMSFNDFQNYLTVLGQQERKAARAGDGTAGHAIGVVRNAFESLPMSEDAAHLKPLLDAARGAAKNRFDKIAADPAYKAAISDDVPIGEPSALADKFVSGYVTGGNVRGANLAQMKANIGGDPVASQTIAAATLDHLKAVAKSDPETGKFLADGYGKGVDKLSMKLGDMAGPEAAQQLEQLAKVAKYTSAQPKGSFVNNSNTLVGALSAPAAAGLRSLLAVKTLGASEAVGAAMKAAKQGKAAKGAVAPGAGINKLMDTPP